MTAQVFKATMTGRQLFAATLWLVLYAVATLYTVRSISSFVWYLLLVGLLPVCWLVYDSQKDICVSAQGISAHRRWVNKQLFSIDYSDIQHMVLGAGIQGKQALIITTRSAGKCRIYGAFYPGFERLLTAIQQHQTIVKL